MQHYPHTYTHTFSVNNNTAIACALYNCCPSLPVSCCYTLLPLNQQQNSAAFVSEIAAEQTGDKMWKILIYFTHFSLLKSFFCHYDKLQLVIASKWRHFSANVAVVQGDIYCVTVLFLFFDAFATCCTLAKRLQLLHIDVDYIH